MFSILLLLLKRKHANSRNSGRRHLCLGVKYSQLIGLHSNRVGSHLSNPVAFQISATQGNAFIFLSVTVLRGAVRHNPTILQGVRSKKTVLFRVIAVITTKKKVIETSRLPHCLDNLLTDGCDVVILTRLLRFTPKRNLGTYFC
jgi:hypothetical protein